MEFLRTYSFCWECGYTLEDAERHIPETNFKAILYQCEDEEITPAQEVKATIYKGPFRTHR